jgi:Alpha/beta hydrolase of unknown function (DUF900)
MRYFLYIILTLSFYKTNAQSTHVLYGERNPETNTTNLYFDKEGLLYPNYSIPNDSLLKSNNSLRVWYGKNEKVFIEIAKKYKCSFDGYSNANCFTLNDSIGAFFTRLLDSKHSNGIAFLIHGFRKPFVAINGDSDSPTDYSTLAQTFQKYYPSNTAIVGVYWDGLYSCCFSSNLKKNARLLRLFEIAQTNAEKTGEGLKKIMSQLNQDTITIITHSLGAKVALYSVLNISTNASSKTPTNKRVNICLIAPAISAESISDNYLKRNPTPAIPTADNYHLFIVYNEKDFALKKKEHKLLLFGPGPYKYGNTTLGCNFKNAALKLETKFKVSFKQSTLRIYNCTKSVGKCHHVRCYCSAYNLKEVFGDMGK